jgi:hypothetical protein
MITGLPSSTRGPYQNPILAADAIEAVVYEDNVADAAECPAPRQESWRYAVFGANGPQNLVEARQVKRHCAPAQRSASNAVTGYIDGIGVSWDAGGSARSAQRAGHGR